MNASFAGCSRLINELYIVDCFSIAFTRSAIGESACFSAIASAHSLAQFSLAIWAISALVSGVQTMCPCFQLLTLWNGTPSASASACWLPVTFTACSISSLTCMAITFLIHWLGYHIFDSTNH